MANLSEAFGSELVLLGAESDDALADRADALVRFLDQAPGVRLADVARTCAHHFSQGSRAATLAIVVKEVENLRARLVSASTRIRSGLMRIRDRGGTYYYRHHLLGGEDGGKLAFVFPGAASFYPDMLRDLAVRFRECRIPFDELEAALSGRDKAFSPSDFVFPPASCYRRDADVFAAGAYAQAVVSTYTANAALARMLESLGIRPDGATGFAGGDLNALVAGGMFGRKFDRDRRIDFLRDVYKVVNSAVDGSGLQKCVMMAMVASRPAEADAVLAKFSPEQVQKAFMFSSNQLTLAIAPDMVEEVLHALSAVGVRGTRLEVDRPFNTPWCEKVLTIFHKLSSRWVDDKPSIPIYSCGTTEPLPVKTRKARDIAADQWVVPVRFSETIRRMYADGFRVFLEVGPRGVMTSVVDDVLRGEEHSALATDSLHRAGLLQLQHTVGALAALGAELDATVLFAGRRTRVLDFDAPFSLEVRSEAEIPLHRELPIVSLPPDFNFGGAMSSEEESTPGARRKGAAHRAAEHRAAAQAVQARRLKQFDQGAMCPLVSDAEVVDDQPGIREIAKTFTISAAPFFQDFAIGSSHLSFLDDKLRGFVPLQLAACAEIMAEVAQMLMPQRRVVVIENLQSRRRLAFKDGKLRLFVRAERTSSTDILECKVRVQLREEGPDSAWTWPAIEGTFVLTADWTPPPAFVPPPLNNVRSVNWLQSDIYPDRLYTGQSLRGIISADFWSEVGLNYQVEVLKRAGTVRHTEQPVWAINPQLLASITDGFQLWRSHERFAGAVSYPFRVRRVEVHAPLVEGMKLKCYLRNTGVTPESLIADVLVSDGNGKVVLELRGYEEYTERVAEDYRQLLLMPASAYLTRPLPDELLGSPDTPYASAMVTDVPYALFERNEELWLRILSHMVLNRVERGEIADLTGSTSRRTEWLFGRIAAKEAVRRLLRKSYQGIWCGADIQVYRDDSGKPHPTGDWKFRINAPVDLAIAHTAQFVVAVAAANARVGVDVEALDRDLSEEFTRGVFTPEELELSVSSVNPQRAVIRFWCAKEAVSKALGTGIRYSPKEMVVESYHPDTGDMTVSLRGQWLESFKQFTGRSINVTSGVVKGHVLASCFLPETLFSN